MRGVKEVKNEKERVLKIAGENTLRFMSPPDDAYSIKGDCVDFMKISGKIR